MIRTQQLAQAPLVSAPKPEAQIQQKLDSLFPPEERRRWLEARQERLHGSPQELIERGEAERVLRILIRLEQGIPT